MGNSSVSAKRPQDIGSFKKQYEKYVISTAINQVNDGVCHGMCLNWVRKMLLTGPDWRPKKDKDYEAKGAVLHTGFQDTTKQWREARTSHLITFVEEQQRNAARMNELWAKKSTSTLSEAEGTELQKILTAAKEGKAKRQEMFQAIQLEKQYFTDLMDSKGGWTREYSAYFQQFKGGGYKKFQRLDANFVDAMGMAGATEQERFSSYFGAIKAKIQTIEAGKGALLNIYKKQGKGHFLAFYRSDDAKDWHFYDPNLGWYRRDSVDNVGQLFEDLYLCVYASRQFEEANWLSVSTA
jgi:hypothetical protein